MESDESLWETWAWLGARMTDDELSGATLGMFFHAGGVRERSRSACDQGLKSVDRRSAPPAWLRFLLIGNGEGGELRRRADDVALP